MKGSVPLRFGPYEIIGELGAGGMGKVYRAKDVRLQREVALKILHESTLGNTDRQRRFAQEAIAAGALNHPNIVAVYDVGVEGETPYLVSELVDGTSLRQELDRGRLPLKRLIDIGAQTADGLTAAHEAKIVHRDLKPENVMITRDGRVKILDFGLAKGGEPDRDELLSPSALTQTADGLLIGTVPYMSPEQAQGARVDFRSDQFSLGLMLYEMTTGTHPFKRETPVQTLSAIIGDEARFAVDPSAALPTPLRWTIERLLAKEPRDRYANTADLAADLRRLRDRLSEALEAPASARATAARLPWLPWTLAALAVAAAFTTGALLRSDTTDASQLKFTPLANNAGYQGAPVFSPDGKTIAYVAEVDDVLQIFTRSLTSSMRNQITHTRFDCHDPFWSPDGKSIYYHALAGYREALWQVSLAGGPPGKVIDLAARAAISPDGRTLALLRDDPDRSTTYTLWLSSPPGAEPKKYTKTPLEDFVFDDGYLRFSSDGSKLLMWLMRDARNERRLQAPRTGFWMLSMPDGVPELVMPSLAGLRAPALFSWFPDNRHIVLVRSDGRTPGSHLWVADTRNDVVWPLTVTNGNEGSPAVAPAGNTIALTSESTDFDLAFVPVDGSGVRTFLSSTRNELDPAWSPVRSEYAFVTDRTGTPEIWLRSEDGNSERPLVTDTDFDGSPTIALGALAFSPDGRRLAYQRFSMEGYRIWISSVAGGPPVQLTMGGWEDAPAWSPDGEWIAFIGGEAGGGLAKIRVGVGAAAPVVLKARTQLFSRPHWSPDGRWILCLAPEGLMLVTPDGKESRILSEEDWLAYEWAADGSTVYGLQTTEDLHHFMLVSVDVDTGRPRVLNANLAAIPQANQPIRGFSRVRNGAFATSIARVRSDIWLLDGFQPVASLWTRLWPFGGSRAQGGAARR